jgi:plasmid replication initiation protein
MLVENWVIKQEGENKKKELKKHIATIHSSNPLSLLQRKISNVLLFHAYPELNQKEEHEITIKQLSLLIGYTGNNSAVLKQALKTLISAVIEWDLVDELTGEEDWTASAMLASVNIKGGLCRYAYSPRLRALLFSPSMYGKINMIVQARFTSSYGLALYENCVRYRGLPATKWFEFGMFRKLMGVEIGEYKAFKDFKKRVIHKAVEDINTHSDLFVEPELIMIGRKLGNIRFKLKEREKRVPIGIISLVNHEGLIKTLIEDFSLSRNQATQLIKDYGEPFISEKINLIRSSNTFKAGKIINLAAFLISAVKEDYQDPKLGPDLFLEKETKVKENKRKETLLEEVEQKRRNDYTEYVSEYLNKKIRELKESGRVGEIETEFKTFLENEKNLFLLEKYNKDGLQSKTVSEIFQNFILEGHRDLLPDLMTYESFCLRFS